MIWIGRVYGGHPNREAGYVAVALTVERIDETLGLMQGLADLAKARPNIVSLDRWSHDTAHWYRYSDAENDLTSDLDQSAILGDDPFVGIEPLPVEVPCVTVTTDSVYWTADEEGQTITSAEISLTELETYREELIASYQAERLLEHAGHRIKIARYGSPVQNVAIECVRCNVIITSADVPAWMHTKGSR